MAGKRKSLGANTAFANRRPHDAVIPRAAEPDSVPDQSDDASQPPAERVTPSPHSPRKERATFYLDAELMEAARDAAYWTPGLALTDLAAQGLRWAIAQLENERGTPFPRRPANLRPGRRMKQ
jgi:hypothetical protein